MNDTEFNYDGFLADEQRCREAAEPSWIIARSVEEAQAFACWCIENGIEEPEIVVLEP